MLLPNVSAVRPLPMRYTASVITNSFLRPSLSESLTKNSAPTTSPTRYTVAMRHAWVDERARVSSSVSLSTTALATVISRPSRIQATPRAITIRVWKGDQGNRSIRAGIRLRITPGAGASRVVVIERLRAGLFCCGRRRSFPFAYRLNRDHRTRHDPGHPRLPPLRRNRHSGTPGQGRSAPPPERHHEQAPRHGTGSARRGATLRRAPAQRAP